MKTRDWVMAAGGAAFACVAVVTLYEVQAERQAVALGARRGVRAGRASDGENGRADVNAEPAHAERGSEELDRVGLPLKGSPDQGGSRVVPPAPAQAEKLRAQLAEILREKRDLETQLHTLESELERGAAAPPTGDPRDFDLRPEDWRALAAQSRVKYRIPCPLPSESAYTLPQEELDRLGLSGDDGQALLEAHRRSNGRVWATLRPLCLEAVGNAEVVELLGTSNCLRLLERAATKRDFGAAADARRRVAEVHAGMVAAPSDGEPASPLFTVLMAVTSEAQLFQADLAATFGPEEAKHIADGMRCVATVR